MYNYPANINVYVSNDAVVIQAIISGVFVFIFSQIFLKFILDPFKEFKGIIGRIDNQLKYYENIITNSGVPSELRLESSKSMRVLSCELESLYKQLWFRKQLSFFCLIPEEKDVSEAATSIIRVSNAGGSSGLELMNYEEVEKIRKVLNIKRI